jgi:hypothetical protein
MSIASAVSMLWTMFESSNATSCAHGRPTDDCPLCEHDEELDDVLDDVLVDVERWAETVLAELDAELRR